MSSADLVSRFYAVWTDEDLASHKRAAEIIARIAHDAFNRAGDAATEGSPLTEYELQQWILGEFAANGLNHRSRSDRRDRPNAANPHFEPAADRQCADRDAARFF